MGAVPRRRRVDLAIVVALMVGVLALMPGVNDRGASADTTGNPDPVTRARVGIGPDPAPTIAPPGPLTGLTEGSVVHVHSDANGGQLFALAVRVCRAGLSIQDTAGFAPSLSGDCIPSPFVDGTDDSFVSLISLPPRTEVDIDFRVGSGTKTFEWDRSDPKTSTITCDQVNPCALWIDHQVPVEASPDNSGHVWKHFDLTYGEPTTTSTSTSTSTSSTIPTSTTSTSSTIPTSTTSTSSTIPTSTTSTTSSTSTTTSTTPSTQPSTTTSTSTSVPVVTSTSSTTSSTVGTSTTSTTLGTGGSTISPTTVVPGGAFDVSSPGWKAGSEVTAVLRSDPVTLGKLTADETGKASGSLTVPLTTTTGVHSLELTGTGASGGARAVALSITVADATTTSTTTGTGTSTSDSGLGTGSSAPGGSLSRTGAESMELLRVGGLAVLSGFVLVLAGRRRARRR